MSIKLEMISDEKAIPTPLLVVQRKRNEVVRIAILTEILDI
jgi:hypothetical protein